MKTFVAVAVALMLLVGVAYAAEVPTSKGDKAMVFMFNGFDDLGLGGYPGEYGFGMRYYIADGTAIRGGVTLGKSSYVEESDEGYDDEEWNDMMMGVNVVYERHLESPCPAVSPYWGVGVGFLSETNEHIYPTGPETSDTTTDKFTGLQVFGALGFEWGFTDCMTLGGEYELGWVSGSGETEYDDERAETYGEWSGSFVGFTTASVYLSVYF